MTEAGFSTHGLPPTEPEVARASLASSSRLNHDDLGEANSTIANTAAAAATVTTTADLMGGGRASAEPGSGSTLVMRNSSNNSENGVTGDSKPALSSSLSPNNAGGEMKESFLVLARTPDPDVDVRVDAEEEEENGKDGGETNMENTRRRSGLGRDAGDTGASWRDPRDARPDSSPVLRGAASAADDSIYEGREDETRVEDEDDGANVPDGSESWHPLSPKPPPPPSQRGRGEVGNDTVIGGQDVTIVVEGGDVVDSHGRVLFHEDELDEKPSAINSPRRTSHLRLDLKPPSPQPWDLVDPPDTNGRPTKEEMYPSHRSRFHSLQNRHRSPIPKSSYYFGPPPPDSAYGTPPVGQIGAHHPREILRIERDYTGGELTQFAPIYPLELEGRITPTQFLESINAINELLISAHSLRHSFFDNFLAVLTLQISRTISTSHYEKEMRRLRHLFDDLNTSLFNPVGLNLLWPRKVAFLYLEIEYY